MSSKNRYRYGQRTLIEVPVASATVIERGDFVLMSSGLAITPASLYAADSRAAAAATARDKIADTFIGIAETDSASGDTDNIVVDISLEAVYALAQYTAEAISVADLLAAYVVSTASASYATDSGDQALDSVTNGTTNPIVVCVKDHTAAQGTETWCKMLPQAVLNKPAGD